MSVELTTEHISLKVTAVRVLKCACQGRNWILKTREKQKKNRH